MKLLFVILLIIIVYFIYNRYKSSSNYIYKYSDTNQSVNHSDDIRQKLREDGFVKPENALLYIFNQMSSLNKVILKGDCQTNIYTKDTIPKNKDEYLIELMTITILRLIGLNGCISPNQLNQNFLMLILIYW